MRIDKLRQIAKSYIHFPNRVGYTSVPHTEHLLAKLLIHIRKEELEDCLVEMGLLKPGKAVYLHQRVPLREWLWQKTMK